MGYQDIKVTDAISLGQPGSTNKKTGKPLLSVIEGYYVTSRQVPDAKKKSGKEFIYTLQTSEGLKEVWGKTNLNRRMSNAVVGAMTRISNTGETQPTPNGDMQLFRVQQDLDNVTDVSALQAEAAADEGSYEEDSDQDQPEAYEAPKTAPARRPESPAQPASAERQASVRAVLGAKR